MMNLFTMVWLHGDSVVPYPTPPLSLPTHPTLRLPSLHCKYQVLRLENYQDLQEELRAANFVL